MIGQMQNDVGEWLQRNFGDVACTDQVLIIAEEVGELAHAVLKRKQGIRTNEDHDAAIKDAVADIVIGVMAFCAVEDLDLETLLNQTWAVVRERDWTKEVTT